jgi:hypothetical protein
MGATRFENKPELIEDICEFNKRTGKLNSFELWHIELPSDNFCGAFTSEDANKLLEFCHKNPAYHIITQTHPGYHENRYVPGKQNTYSIGDGDQNPNLILWPFRKDHPELLMQRLLNKALTESDNIDGSR